MKSKKLFTIKFVSSHTGIKAHVIRAWESRYAAVVPERTQTNRRIYCQQDISRLRMLKLATEAGHAISRIAQASEAELCELLNLSATPMGAGPAPLDPVADNRPSAEAYLKTCLNAVKALDPDKLNRSLSRASLHLTRQRWVEALIVPMFNRIGELWASGRLKILNEHIASNCARTIMGDMLRSVEIAPTAPCIVIGTPVGQWHELGALSAALASAEAGWRPVYVGASLPCEELAAAVDQFDARCIALSLTHPLDDNRLQQELLNLRRLIGPDRHIIIGGLCGNRWRDLIRRIGAQRLDGWQDVLNTLRVLAMR